MARRTNATLWKGKDQPRYATEVHRSAVIGSERRGQRIAAESADSKCEGLAWKRYAECCNGNATGGADRVRLAKEKHGPEMQRHDGQRNCMEGIALRSERQRNSREEI